MPVVEVGTAGGVVVVEVVEEVLWTGAVAVVEAMFSARADQQLNVDINKKLKQAKLRGSLSKQRVCG